MVGKFVLVRTYSAGIHCGILKSISGTEAILENSRRIWRWKGANTLSEMSVDGIDQIYSRISEPVENILLTQSIEVIPCSDIAIENLSRSRWGQ